MFLNIAADVLIGSIPLAGELFDVGWKANMGNAKLLRELEQNPDQLVMESRWQLWSLVIILVAIILALLWAIGWILAEIVELIYCNKFQMDLKGKIPEVQHSALNIHNSQFSIIPNHRIEPFL